MKTRSKREIGTIVRWSEGWGFAKPHARSFDVFLHADKIIGGAPRVRVGALVEFEIAPDMKRPYAMKIKVLN